MAMLSVRLVLDNLQESDRCAPGICPASAAFAVSGAQQSADHFHLPAGLAPSHNSVQLRLHKAADYADCADGRIEIV